MFFAAPKMLWLALLIPAALVCVIVAIRRQDRFLHLLGDRHLQQFSRSRLPSIQTPWVYHGLLVAALCLTILALADPRLPHGRPRLRTGSLDVVMLIDVSKSMLAEDYAGISRLQMARGIIRDLLIDLVGSRIGFVTFAGTSFRQAELNDDYPALAFITDHWLQVDSAGVGGSDLARAISIGLEMFEPQATAERVLLLLSDGGTASEALEAALAKANHQGVNIITLGMGKPMPARIPIYDDGTFVGYLQEGERTITTKLNEPLLQRIAAATQGTYRHITSQSAPSTLLPDLVSSRHLVRDQRRIFQFFLLAALFCWGGHLVVVRL